MGIKINVPFILRHIAGNQDSVEVNGKTVRECMNDLISQFPDSQEWFDDNNPSVWFVLNQELVSLKGLDKKVTECDELSLIMILGGG
jgi:molybdopterin converting factor small subunit